MFFFVFIFNFLNVNCFSFLDMSGLVIIIFDEKNIFLGPQGPTGTLNL